VNKKEKERETERERERQREKERECVCESESKSKRKEVDVLNALKRYENYRFRGCQFFGGQIGSVDFESKRH
jgi:hypothetical protein